MKRSEGPKSIQSFFREYKKRLKAPEESVCKEFVEVVADLLSIPIQTTDVSFQPQTKTIQIKKGMVRTEILLHKKEILAHMSGRVGVRSAPKNII